jgi:hypothetical protein
MKFGVQHKFALGKLLTRDHICIWQLTTLVHTIFKNWITNAGLNLRKFAEQKGSTVLQTKNLNRMEFQGSDKKYIFL